MEPNRESRDLMGRFAGCRMLFYSEGVAVLGECLVNKERLPAGNRLINMIPVLKGDPGWDS
ncbi:MAG: hypothetical protein LBG06_02895 [Deltaproteobacteria bacterium]|jgi:hypothetical protein|nr:hypothetical protein [Deltaproteobacteria bacterium]